MFNNLIIITLLILVVIILIMLYFISSDSRRNKNNINICESNIQTLKDKISSFENKLNEMSSMNTPPNLEGMLNQLNQQQFMNSNDLMFPLGEEYNDDEDEDDEDDEDDENDDDVDDD